MQWLYCNHYVDQSAKCISQKKHNFCSATRILDSEYKDLEKGVGRKKVEGEGQR